jgi:hypothetical protein
MATFHTKKIEYPVVLARPLLSGPQEVTPEVSWTALGFAALERVCEWHQDFVLYARSSRTHQLVSVVVIVCVSFTLLYLLLRPLRRRQ